jgi:hypothetical protein
LQQKFAASQDLHNRLVAKHPSVVVAIFCRSPAELRNKIWIEAASNEPRNIYAIEGSKHSLPKMYSKHAIPLVDVVNRVVRSPRQALIKLRLSQARPQSWLCATPALAYQIMGEKGAAHW